ncbi:MAG TPA: hypothetical protein VFC63_07795 [Blastocatellia bacterium]|nr:hypothetical protein [Blastocatellia bacterium]
MQADVRKTLARMTAEMVSIIAAAPICMFGTGLIAALRHNQMELPPMIEPQPEPMLGSTTLVFGAALGVAVIASTIAAKNASIGRSAVLGLISGLLAAACMVTISKHGITSPTSTFAVAILATLVIGFGLQLTLNRQSSAKPS